MKTVLEDIKNGSFAQRFIDDQDAGGTGVQGAAREGRAAPDRGHRPRAAQADGLGQEPRLRLRRGHRHPLTMRDRAVTARGSPPCIPHRASRLRRSARLSRRPRPPSGVRRGATSPRTAAPAARPTASGTTSQITPATPSWPTAHRSVDPLNRARLGVVEVHPRLQVAEPVLDGGQQHEHGRQHAASRRSTPTIAPGELRIRTPSMKPIIRPSTLARTMSGSSVDRDVPDRVGAGDRRADHVAEGADRRAPPASTPRRSATAPIALARITRPRCGTRVKRGQSAALGPLAGDRQDRDHRQDDRHREADRGRERLVGQLAVRGEQDRGAGGEHAPRCRCWPSARSRTGCRTSCAARPTRSGASGIGSVTRAGGALVACVQYGGHAAAPSRCDPGGPFVWVLGGELEEHLLEPGAVGAAELDQRDAGGAARSCRPARGRRRCAGRRPDGVAAMPDSARARPSSAIVAAADDGAGRARAARPWCPARRSGRCRSRRGRRR